MDEADKANKVDNEAAEEDTADEANKVDKEADTTKKTLYEIEGADNDVAIKADKVDTRSSVAPPLINCLG